MVDMFMCSGGEWWICSCAVVFNVGYVHVQSWSMVDMFMCSGGECWICSCAVHNGIRFPVRGFQTLCCAIFEILRGIGGNHKCMNILNFH